MVLFNPHNFLYYVHHLIRPVIFFFCSFFFWLVKMTERPKEENLMKVIKNYSPSFGNSGFTRLKENFIIFLSV